MTVDCLILLDGQNIRPLVPNFFSVHFVIGFEYLPLATFLQFFDEGAQNYQGVNFAQNVKKKNDI